MFVTFS